MTLNAADAVALTQRLVRTPGLSGSERQVADVVETAMEELGFRDIRRDDLGSVTGVVGPAGERPRLLFDGHMDVVPVVGEWTMDPFGAEIRDGRIYGRGTTDMKGGLAAALCGAALSAATGQLAAPVAVCATVFEETMEGVALGRVMDRLQPEAVIICEPSSLVIQVGQRGRAEVLVTLHGRPAHAAYPERGRNPIELAASAIEVIKTARLPHDDVLGDAIIVCTDVISDPYPSVSLIPAAVQIRYDRRTLIGETADTVTAGLEGFLSALGPGASSVRLSRTTLSAYTGTPVEAPVFLPAWRLPDDHELARDLQRAVERAGVPLRLGTYGVCTNGSESAGVRGVPTVGFGPGDAADAHTPDESVSVDEVTAAAAVFRELCLLQAGSNGE